MDNKRRKFLKIAGASVLAGIGAPALVKLSTSPAVASGGGDAKPAGGHAPAAGHGEEEATGIRLGMVIDMRKFYKDQPMLDRAIEACYKVHNIPKIPNTKSEIKWIWKTGYGNAFTEHSQKHRSEDVKNNGFPVLCNHCDNPSCVKACPTKATFVAAKGIVAMDFHRCIGCRFCMAACPYGARSFNWQDPRPFIKEYNADFPTRMRGVVEKCNFCGERLALGLEPACVEACEGTGAMVFGDLNDPHSEVRKVLDKEYTIQRKPSAGTKPSVFYIV